MVKRKDDSVLNEEALAGQIPEYVEPKVETKAEPSVYDMVGTKLGSFTKSEQVYNDRIAEAESHNESIGGTKLGGNIYEAGNAKEFKTGDWRSITPVYKPDSKTKFQT